MNELENTTTSRFITTDAPQTLPEPLNAAPLLGSMYATERAVPLLIRIIIRRPGPSEFWTGQMEAAGFVNTGIDDGVWEAPCSEVSAGLGLEVGGLSWCQAVEGLT